MTKAPVPESVSIPTSSGHGSNSSGVETFDGACGVGVDVGVGNRDTIGMGSTHSSLWSPEEAPDPVSRVSTPWSVLVAVEMMTGTAYSRSQEVAGGVPQSSSSTLHSPSFAFM